MFMTAAERESPPSTGRAAETRSPFARLNELLTPHAPGKPVINCAVGEPQHPMPDFVGAVLAANLAEFARYPANKGTDLFRGTASRWLTRRFDLPRAPDPDHEVLVLNGTREGLFLAAIAAARIARKQKPAILVPNPCYGAYSAGALAAHCETVYL